MMPDEKGQLLTVFAHSSAWCRHAEAQDLGGEAVHYDDPAAVAWDLTGALCRLFGWDRACVLFEQVDRHLHGRRRTGVWPERDTEMDAMAALQEFNDSETTTFEFLSAKIQSLPVWRGPGATGEADALEAGSGVIPCPH